MLAIQYLEYGPKIAEITVPAARERLRAALDRLPITRVLLGWGLPEALVDGCAAECQRTGAQLYRWHPLLAGNEGLLPRPEWQTIGLNGEPVPGFRGMPEFTFVCPNRPAVRETVREQLQHLLQDDRYQGLFLDRIRYPSPVHDPGRALACFCEDCVRAAAWEGIDLRRMREPLARWIDTPQGTAAYVRALLDPGCAITAEPEFEALAVLLDFRSASVGGFVEEIAGLVRHHERRVGLDCFSPALARMVGQDLEPLSACADWIKVMSYGHVLGPSGLPFELLGLADWLIDQRGFPEDEALALLAEASHLPLPPDRAALRRSGLSSEALHREGQRAREVCAGEVLAGIELVEIPGIAELSAAQIAADLAAFRQARVDGLVLSWDLWEIAPERLDLVREGWGT